MTPLAHRITRRLADGQFAGEPLFGSMATEALRGAHFFKASAALPLIEQVWPAIMKSHQTETPMMACTAPACAQNLDRMDA